MFATATTEDEVLVQYGDFVLRRHNKTRALGNHKPETEYLGYSTTAFYFYNLCDCTDPPAINQKTGHPDAHNRQTCSKGGSAIDPKYLADAGEPVRQSHHHISLQPHLLV